MGHRISFVGISLVAGFAAADVQAVVIPVTYQNNSWVQDGVPVAIATPTTAGTTPTPQSIFTGRKLAQTFTTVDAFTLDKIWIKYFNVKPGTLGYSFEVQLFRIPNATPGAANINPLPADQLFSQPQVHILPHTMNNNAVDNYAIFDVENVALAANTTYAFMFTNINILNANNFAYSWLGFSNDNTYPGGTYYRVDSGDQLADRAFALQPLIITAPPPPAAAMPEPATGLACLLGGAVMSVTGRGRRSARRQ